jgi:F420-dependent oxidoreductase-like protein
MKLGLSLGHLRGAADVATFGAAEEADRLGYSVVWASEAYGSDVVSVLGYLAGRTTSVALGSAIMQIPGRTPAMTAMTAATLDVLSGGRFRCGVGVSGPQVSEGWHGVRFAHQLARTREYVAIVRKALDREKLEFHGEHFELPLPDGPGKALKLTIKPVQDRIPIYLAAIGPKNTALAGEIADGWIPTLLSPEFLPELRKNLEEGAAQAGRTLENFDIAPTVNVFITDDLAAARDATRPFVGLYVGGMGSKKQNFYNALMKRYGFEEAAEKVQDLYLSGQKEEAMAALPAEFLDQVALIGPRDVVRERLTVYRDAGVGTLGVTPLAFDKPGRLDQLRQLAEVFEEIA